MWRHLRSPPCLSINSLQESLCAVLSIHTQGVVLPASFWGNMNKYAFSLDRALVTDQRNSSTLVELSEPLSLCLQELGYLKLPVTGPAAVQMTTPESCVLRFSAQLVDLLSRSCSVLIYLGKWPCDSCKFHQFPESYQLFSSLQMVKFQMAVNKNDSNFL